MKRSMILLIPFLLTALLSLASSAFCFVEQIKMKVTDASDSGSPITLSGEVVFTDAQTSPTPYSFQATASATNVSGRDILLVVVSFEVTGTHKFDLLETDQQDYFFSPHPLRPGAAQEFDPFSARYGPSAGRTDPEQTEPQATARLEFVQFADGSIWGDADSAEQTMEFRKETLTELNMLQKVYRSGGGQAFTEELSKPSILPAINALKDVCSEKKNDSGCLVDAMTRVIQDAKQHAVGLRPDKAVHRP
jgi:hypothetical protein